MSDEEYRRALEIQRRNFEAQFGSIESLGFEDKSKTVEESSTSSKSDNESESEQEQHDFQGFESDSNSDISSEELDEDSEEEEQEEAPKVVKLNSTTSTPIIISKQDRKLLKSGRAPTLHELSIQAQRATKQTPAQVKEDSENLENDLKLQRLLQESHILTYSLEHSGAELTLETIDYEDPTGKARRRILDSRMRQLASVNSVRDRKLESMPMAMRKGMITSRDKKVKKFEAEARDAGIVLSKVRKGHVRDLNEGRGSTSASDRLGSGVSKNKNKKHVRDRGLKIHQVGRSTRNGLVLSQGEIEKINNKGKKFNKKGKKFTRNSR
ncbi:Protein FAF1 [Spathaspora sp. JA1]|nr:Protein FAF1 [Spathaspora sp. JA1]